MDIAPGFSAFASAYEQGRPQALYVRLIADLETPVSAFLKLAEGRANAFLFESVQGGETRGRYSIIGLKPDLIWRCRNGKAEINRNARTDADAFVPDADADRPLVSLKRLVKDAEMELPAELPPMAVGMFGYLGYDIVRHMERLPSPPPDVLGLPEGILLRPTIMAIFDNIRDEIIVVTPVWPEKGLAARAAYARGAERLQDIVADLERAGVPAPAPDVQAVLGPAQSNTGHDEYLAMVEKAKEYIRAGDIFQVVPSQRFRRAFSLPPFALYRALRRLNPSPFLYFLNFPGFAIVGSSPEILVRLRDSKVTIRPIAGTRPRGKTPEEDQRLADELMADPKERAEHLMLLDLGRNDVGRVAQTGTVHVTDQFFIERYSHVMHLVSNVEGVIRPGLDAVDALVAGFPAGTLSGAPKVRAMEIIDELEKEKRGVYAGAVGYFAANGSMDTCIVLRTAVVKDCTMYVQAGGGVVADSDPEAEFQETVNKAKALMAAADEAVRYASMPKRGQ
ncbi:MAG TPA: anthranilate synthase component I [Micropepsaceae bacterium]|jgi:anthranilate synthase component 1|nr:anthranilate synthase component I [Micropepsaceae bacterium]